MYIVVVENFLKVGWQIRFKHLTANPQATISHLSLFFLTGNKRLPLYTTKVRRQIKGTCTLFFSHSFQVFTHITGTQSQRLPCIPSHFHTMTKLCVSQAITVNNCLAFLHVSIQWPSSVCHRQSQSKNALHSFTFPYNDQALRVTGNHSQRMPCIPSRFHTMIKLCVSQALAVKECFHSFTFPYNDQPLCVAGNHSQRLPCVPSRFHAMTKPCASLVLQGLDKDCLAFLHVSMQWPSSVCHCPRHSQSTIALHSFTFPYNDQALCDIGTHSQRLPCIPSRFHTRTKLCMSLACSQQLPCISLHFQPLCNTGTQSKIALHSFTFPYKDQAMRATGAQSQSHRMPCFPSRFHIMTKPCASQEASRLSSQLKQTSSTGAECPSSLLTHDLLSLVTSKKYTHMSSLPETERRDKGV